jgi:hypothetical protein
VNSFPGQDKKIQPLDSESDQLTALRKLMDMKLKPIYFREIRPHLVAEQITFDADTEQVKETQQKMLG